MALPPDHIDILTEHGVTRIRVRYLRSDIAEDDD